MSIGFVSPDPLNNLTNTFQRPIIINAGRAPLSTDIYPPGTQWQFNAPYSSYGGPIYETPGGGVWNESGHASSSFVTDSGTATPTAAGVLNLIGGSGSTPNTGITISGSGSTATVETTFAKNDGTDLNLFFPGSSNNALFFDTNGNVTLPSGDLTISRATGLPEVLVTQTGGTYFARFVALGTSPKTGYFSSAISTPLYWNFGMASTLSNAFCLNTNNASVAPEGGTIILQISQTGLLTLNSSMAGDGINVMGSTSGGTNVIQIENSDTTSMAVSSAGFLSNVTGTSAGNPYISWTVGSTTSYALGIDNPTSGDPLTLTYANASSVNPSTGTTLMTVTSSGAATFPAGTVTAIQCISSGDSGGVSSTISTTNASSATISTGVGSVKMSTANAATNTAWIKIYIGTSAFWIPAWTTNSP